MITIAEVAALRIRIVEFLHAYPAYALTTPECEKMNAEIENLKALEKRADWTNPKSWEELEEIWKRMEVIPDKERVQAQNKLDARAVQISECLTKVLERLAKNDNEIPTDRAIRARRLAVELQDKVMDIIELSGEGQVVKAVALADAMAPMVDELVSIADNKPH